jgi:CDP-Glycerol:Poly(glycerophosphate) glycerophosphotransferase
MLQEAPTAAEGFGARVAPHSAGSPERRVWLVLSDPMANRIFFECGIVERLRTAFPDRLQAVFLLHPKHLPAWLPRLQGVPVLEREDVLPTDVPPTEATFRRLDRALDKRVGFYPLAIRHSRRHGFFRDRMAPGHPVPFLDSSRVGPLPQWRLVDSAMARWHLSRWRHVPSALRERMRDECAALVVTNPQAPETMPLLTAARRLHVPVVGYIASWDHQVGKGVISPHFSRYVVQNETMRRDLERFHGIGPERVTVTGWPQTDVYARQRSLDEYHASLRGLGLAVDRPVVLFAGNSPNNSPYEANLVERLVSWRRGTDAGRRFSLLFRPHPYDDQVRARFAAAFDEPDVAVQRVASTDYGDLVTLLQHVDCVVATGGTIVLEALVNDRPAVCVTFAEGAPAGFDAADRTNQTGEHYRALIESEAFYRAGDFDELVATIGRALRNPSELQAERKRVSHEVVGEIDGRAADRVVAAIRETVARNALSHV